MNDCLSMKNISHLQCFSSLLFIRCRLCEPVVKANCEGFHSLVGVSLRVAPGQGFRSQIFTSEFTRCVVCLTRLTTPSSVNRKASFIGGTLNTFDTKIDEGNTG